MINENHDSLEKLRLKIDEIDDKILTLIKERMDLMPQVAKAKIEQSITVTDKKREEEILTSKKAKAQKQGIDPMMVEDVYKAIIKGSKKIQDKIIAEKK